MASNDSQNDSETIVVVGAGIAGLLAARFLAERGHRCELLDARPDVGQGCSRHAGGMLAPLSELDIAEPVVAHLGLDAVARWREILGPHAAGDLFDARGSLLVAHRPEWPLLTQLAERARSAGLAERIKPVSQREIDDLEPWLAGRMRRGLWIPDEGVVHPRRLLPALRAQAEAAGVDIRPGTLVERVAPGVVYFASRVAGRVADRERRVATVVDCRGLGARPDLPLRGVRGEYIVVKPRQATPARPVRLMHPRYPLYIVPRPDRRLYIGATQLESEYGGPVHVRSALELLSALYSLDPGFADAEIETMGVGLRPALSDNLPRLRVSPGLISVNGLFRHGYLLAPRMCQWVVDAIEGRAVPDDAARFWQSDA